MKPFWLLLLLSSSLYGTGDKSLSFEQMTLEERKKTGIEKLSQEERFSLELWIKNPKKDRPQGIRRAVFLSEAAITRASAQETTITLDNGEIFELTAYYQKKTKEWKIGDKVRVYQSKKPFWFKFEHVPTQAIVGAKKIVQQEKNVEPPLIKT